MPERDEKKAVISLEVKEEIKAEVETEAKTMEKEKAEKCAEKTEIAKRRGRKPKAKETEAGAVEAETTSEAETGAKARAVAKVESGKQRSAEAVAGEAETGADEVATGAQAKADEIAAVAVQQAKAERGKANAGGVVISDELVEAAQWYLRLRETNNWTFLPLFADQHRYLVLVGGGGSGKSIFAGRKILERVTSEPGHRWLVCRKVAKTMRESCFRQLCDQAGEFYPGTLASINHTDMAISFANGSQILFAGLDDAEKLKSIYNITGIWIEEASELLESDFNQLDIRLRGETAYYKQIIVSFNPVSIMHWLKKRFFDSADPRARTHHSTYHDNRFLDEEAKRTLEAFKDSDEYYYTVYCLGQWGVTGKSVFDAASINRRLAAGVQPQHTGYFAYDDDGLRLSNINWVDDADGLIRIYRLPQAGYPYVIGGDTAGDGSDSFVAQVIDNTDGGQAAVLRRGRLDEDIYARQVYCLGVYYNEALVGIEANYSTYPVMELERLRYPRQYVRETIDDYTHAPKTSYGFLTTPKTRPVVIAGLIKAVREDISLINDRDTLHEMLTFVRNEDFRPEAELGAHDDCIMALAIAHYIRPQQSYSPRLQAQAAVEWTRDMWEDYRNAGKEGKQYLIQKWGRPKK